MKHQSNRDPADIHARTRSYKVDIAVEVAHLTDPPQFTRDPIKCEKIPRKNHIRINFQPPQYCIEYRAIGIEDIAPPLFTPIGHFLGQGQIGIIRNPDTGYAHMAALFGIAQWNAVVILIDVIDCDLGRVRRNADHGVRALMQRRETIPIDAIDSNLGRFQSADKGRGSIDSNFGRFQSAAKGRGFIQYIIDKSLPFRPGREHIEHFLNQKLAFIAADDIANVDDDRTLHHRSTTSTFHVRIRSKLPRHSGMANCSLNMNFSPPQI